MQVIKIILMVIYFIVCFALIVLAMMQSKEDVGLSSTITGSSSNNFFEKNKGNTREGNNLFRFYFKRARCASLNFKNISI